MSSETRRDVYPQVAGHPALDLINTVEWRLSEDRREDDLHDYEDVLRWAEQVAIVSPDEARAVSAAPTGSASQAVEEYERVRALREALYASLFDGAGASALTREYADVVAQGRLAPEGAGWVWVLPVDLALPRRRIALAAMDLLTHADLGVLAQCQDAECGWVFLDESPRRNRRWCVASDCGNRNRGREFYRRSRGIAGPGVVAARTGSGDGGI